MHSRLQGLAVALTAMTTTAAAPTAAAQDTIVKLGVSRYTTHSQTDGGVTGIGVPPGADAESGDATTLLLTYERLITPQIGIELVLGIPPKIKARATGTVAFLGDDVLSAQNVSPTVFAVYHFGESGSMWRPYLGAGINFTRFVSIKSKLAPSVTMSDSIGWAVEAGVDYALSSQWGLFGSVAALQVKSKIVASGVTVLQTTIDFRPIVYSVGVAYRF